MTKAFEEQKAIERCIVSRTCPVRRTYCRLVERIRDHVPCIFRTMWSEIYPKAWPSCSYFHLQL